MACMAIRVYNYTVSITYMYMYVFYLHWQSRFFARHKFKFCKIIIVVFLIPKN